ncbi:MAG: glutamine synthetase type III [Lentisphaerae bacterium]|nr:glutamine synthetase type III [Lentisphaerota bacterium]MCP4101451.1 glutamine synthetase type III [Lentisphaerota bacterium]
MSSFTRKQAIAAIAEDCIEDRLEITENAITDVYGKDVFTLKVMKEFLPKDVFKKLVQTVKEGKEIDPGIADDVANAMKQWAISKRASHYTHWFQPLTGSTAEKHDSFVEADGDGNVILNFSGKNLIVGEPDASSFPSGGLRSTFEARGYTAWDPTSPAFIKRGKNGSTLCIPTAFCSYTGEALDKKTPLLRSIQAVNTQVERLLKCFGEEDAGRPEVTLGAEQEYFLIDKRIYMCRPDLIQTGRTLFGAAPSKHQQLDDHYFGAIKPRVLAFMTEVDQELWKLAIPAKTRHNEVAPAQFEIAPMFEELNLAVDHNMIMMEILRQVADRHGFVCLLHEKPFAGVNGSGKHNNWSIGTSTMNLLKPGKNPHRNALFLTTLCAIIKAVHVHGDLLRVSTAAAGNDHRLGANEAPPAIISIFLGEQLTDVIEQIECGEAKSSKKSDAMKIGVDALPPLPRDTTDRNRTSPFAFTGNKFEFRAPGSSQSCAGCNIIINTIVAETLDEICTELEKTTPETFQETLQKVLQKIIKEHKNIIFNGDNYSHDWVVEAERRGLPNLKNTPTALRAFTDEKNIKLFKKYGVFCETEVQSRYEVFMEEYITKINIEGELALNIARTMIMPAALKQQRHMAESLLHLRELGIFAGTAEQESLVSRIGELVGNLVAECDKLEKANESGEPEKIIEAMSKLRMTCDYLENIVSDECWPLPKYSEMLFIY